MSALALPADAAATGPNPDNGVAVLAAGLVRRYGEGDTSVDALRGVTLGIETGRLTAIMGPSGSGKSTLMHLMAGLDTPSEGTGEIDGVDITTLSQKKLTLLRPETNRFVFPFFHLLPLLTA